MSSKTAARIVLLLIVYVISAMGQGRAGRGGPPATGKPGALIDLTGYWVSLINEDWRWRMVTPPKGDFASIPLNANGRKVGEAWDAAKDESEGAQCKAYGAAGLMRLPTRLHITWADDMTLKLDTDAGKQTRLFHFDGAKWKGGEAQWQGESNASWEKQLQFRGFGPPFGGPSPGKGGALKVVTAHMKPGYLRRNGVPYSADAVLTEYFDRIDQNGVSYLILTSIVTDPEYLTGPFITSEQFKDEPDGAKWNPVPCRSQ